MDIRESLLYGVLQPAFKYGFRATKEPQWIHFKPPFERYPQKKRRELARLRIENFLLERETHTSTRTLIHPSRPNRNISVSVTDDGEIHCALRTFRKRKSRRATFPSGRIFRVDSWITVVDPSEAIAFVKKHAKRISRKIHGKEKDARPVRS